MTIDQKYSIEYTYQNKTFKAIAVLKEILPNLFRFKTDCGYNTLFTTTLLYLNEEQILTIKEL